ncbi:hypothetical protein ACIQM0_26995 [Streptomyces sp. NPDC091387]|uniref:hypothetical protein n=1 Tax=Streptomyces sp. NPDC091387 TaxID=3365998 RepID=UPI0037F62EE9
MNHSLAGPQFLAAYTPPTDADTILGILAWCASAAGVGGLIIVGIQMALQLRRGDPGEGGEHFRGVFYVTLSCLVATTAGPLVAALGALSLLGP